jgi:hypothetical protein
MRGTIWIVVVAVCAAAACGSNSTSGEIDARFDAAGSGAIDAPKGGPDANAAGTVACGTLTAPTTCALPAMACCDFPPGTGTDYCYTVAGGICEGGQPIRCDGPEDCMNGEGCCYNASSGSSCTEVPTCAPSGGQIMCHVGDDSPCGTGGHCCELHSAGASGGSPFGTCHPGSCPV